jgi:hypothetical protein
VLDEIHVVPHQVADVSKGCNPYPGSKTRIDAEAGEVHPGKSSGERDEVPYHWDEPARKGADLSVRGKELIYFEKLFMGQKEIPPIPHEQWPSQIIGERIVEQRAQKTADGSG